MVLTKVAHNDAKSLKKIGCIFPHHLGGGGVRPWCGKFHKIFIFLTLYPSLIYIFHFFSLTIHATQNIKEGMTITDVDGQKQDFSQNTVNVMIGVSWACFIGSWLINIAYYKFHPSSVDVFSLDVFSKKRLFHIFRHNTFVKKPQTKRKPGTDKLCEVELESLTARDCTKKRIIRPDGIFSWEIFDEKNGNTQELVERLTKAEEENIKLVAEIEQLRAERNK